MLLRARVVLPVSAPPIKDGVVGILNRRIVRVGAWKDLPAPERSGVVDLGDRLLMPGLINAHCHLNYTNMAGKILPPKRFTNWIQSIVALKADWSYTEFADSWLSGARQLLDSGTTTVADVQSIPELLPEVWNLLPLRVISFAELINLKSGSDPKPLLESIEKDYAGLKASRGKLGLSPHSPYTTTTGLLKRAAAMARKNKWRLTTHVAESEDEFQMFMYRQGPLHDWLKSQRNMDDCGHGSPIMHLDQAGYLSDQLLAVHVNHLGKNDAEILGRKKVHVVHCPGSHEYFQHLKFPGAALASAGVNLCLGTDSLASMPQSRGTKPTLNMFTEMTRFAKANPDWKPNQVLRMATTHAARALGFAKVLGEFIPGALADLIALPYQGSAQDAEAFAVQFPDAVDHIMIEGAWVKQNAKPIPPSDPT